LARSIFVEFLECFDEEFLDFFISHHIFWRLSEDAHHLSNDFADFTIHFTLHALEATSKFSISFGSLFNHLCAVSKAFVQRREQVRGRVKKFVEEFKLGERSESERRFSHKREGEFVPITNA
jgi:hypothetical protein